jgi:hypothetical protein
MQLLLQRCHMALHRRLLLPLLLHRRCLRRHVCAHGHQLGHAVLVDSLVVLQLPVQ